MNDTELAAAIERDFYAALAANNAAEAQGRPAPNENLTTLREFLHERGFSYRWLTQHGYTDPLSC